MTDLESHLREHYARARLSDARIEQILAAAPARATPPRVWYARLGSLAAALVIGLGGLHFHLVERDIAARVLAEVAMNHGKQLDVEIASGDIAVVASALDRLDIPLRPSSQWPARYALLGGRYCSIQGGLAAQLKLRDQETGDLHTLYATRLTSDLETVVDTATTYDNVGITFWRDGDVFFTLAGGETPNAWPQDSD
ncbi:MAG: hypothetical protein OXH60_13780 [Rhodospirillales bacterium]|nr:hypothetical protein [Rhodospirillales bacterium]